MALNLRVKALGLLMLLLVSCRAGDGISPQPTLSTPTSKPEVLADCFLYFHLSAWEDFNADGIRQAGEIPLEGVEFTVEGLVAHSVSGLRGVSNSEGQAMIDIWQPGGCIGEFTISASAPEGYLASGETLITVSPDQAPLDFAFGFYPAFAECGVGLLAYAWLDADGDGLQGESEPYLAGVAFEIREAGTGNRIGEEYSKESGPVPVGVSLNCADPVTAFEVVAVPPEGYELTTDSAVPLTEEVSALEEGVGFGLQEIGP